MSLSHEPTSRFALLKFAARPLSPAAAALRQLTEKIERIERDCPGIVATFEQLADGILAELQRRGIDDRGGAR